MSENEKIEIIWKKSWEPRSLQKHQSIMKFMIECALLNKNEINWQKKWFWIKVDLPCCLCLCLLLPHASWLLRDLKIYFFLNWILSDVRIKLCRREEKKKGSKIKINVSFFIVNNAMKLEKYKVDLRSYFLFVWNMQMKLLKCFLFLFLLNSFFKLLSYVFWLQHHLLSFFIIIIIKFLERRLQQYLNLFDFSFPHTSHTKF